MYSAGITYSLIMEMMYFRHPLSSLRMLLWKGIYNAVCKHNGNLYWTMELFSLWLCLYSSNTLRTCLHCRLWGVAETPHLRWSSSWLPCTVRTFPEPTFWQQVSIYLEQCRKFLGCQKCCSTLAWKVSPYSCVLKRLSTVWSILSHVCPFSAVQLLWH